ncbi:MAG: uroporphyrinogen-III C-methyltransferase, partial [Rhodospirillales bacterium]|nr:uroporphyrinogen-III C-methyltransferase [Rhodospirillales bacterium]
MGRCRRLGLHRRRAQEGAHSPRCGHGALRRARLRRVDAGQPPQSGCRGRRARANGSVTLVGAGPGDAELLTLRAVRALQGADVILYDDLVSDDVLELARREAKRM